jgi:hypothetical protein
MKTVLNEFVEDISFFEPSRLQTKEDFWKSDWYVRLPQYLWICDFINGRAHQPGALHVCEGILVPVVEYPKTGINLYI